MLRRIIVPFVELFFILLLVFIGLYLLTAALTGEGDTRSQEELHVLDVEVNLPFASVDAWLSLLEPFVSDDPLTFELPSGTYRSVGVTMEVASRVSYEQDEGWVFGWSSAGNGDWMYGEERSILLEGRCSPFEDSRDNFENGQHRPIRLNAEDLESPSTVIETVATGGKDSDFTFLVEDIYDDQVYSYRFRVLFQPKEMQRGETILRFGLPVMPLLSDNSTTRPGITFSHEILGQEVDNRGAITISNINEEIVSEAIAKQSNTEFAHLGIFNIELESENGKFSHGQSIPLVFNLPECVPFPMVYLYAIIGPNGVELLAHPPGFAQ